MIWVWFFILSLHYCFAAIYHLNDSEHRRMPPLFALDDYDSCLVEEGSTYCLLQLQLYAKPGNELLRTIVEYSNHKLKHYNYSLIDRGVCTKKTCQKFVSKSKTAEDLRDSLELCLDESMRREYGLRARVSKLYYCDQYDEPWSIDAWDWVVLVVVLALAIINVIGSFYDYSLRRQSRPDKEDGNTFLLNFSVIRNWERLTNEATYDPSMHDLRFLNGYRVILNLWTVFMHAIFCFTGGFMDNPHDIEKAYENPGYLFLFSALKMVHLFFFASGFLVVYHLRVVEQKTPLTTWDLPKIMLQRLSRLVPVLGVTLAISSTWVRHAGSGPLWKLFVTGSLAADCRRYMWRHLFFVNNYSEDTRFCLIQTWQLAAEMQVFVVCMSAYVLVRGRGRAAALGGLLVLGSAAPALHAFLWDLDPLVLTPQNIRTLNEGGPFWQHHTPGHNNLPSFILGMLTASRLHDCQERGIPHVSRWPTLWQYLSVVAIHLILYSGSAFYVDGPRAPLLARVAYIFAMRLLLGIVCMLFFTACCVKNSSYIKSFFEWRGWRVPSRLTYCVFVLHMILVDVVMGARTQLSHFALANIMSVHLLITVSSYILAVPFSLMVETPFIVLFKKLVTKTRSTSGKNGSYAIKSALDSDKISNGNETKDCNSTNNETSNVKGMKRKKLL